MMEAGETGAAVVSTTVGSAEEAKRLARALVEARVAACVQIVAIDSVNRWNGAVEESAEWLLLCKIAAADFPEVSAAIRARHSYEVPEIVLTPIAAGHPPYIDWIAASVER